ncbi:MAG: AarF/ABC1/UbiB kinase family protein [Myxococcales bacterium]|jgi:predicted unusual protein kinase regulating ubiquinone biosynthesis (AarF/ABC1/UbiB family)|nr:AarF/ABC1/UbiB kinase family protein [Myxococcales bacterium]
MRPSSRVPSGRLNRLLQLGTTGARMAAGGLVEKGRRLKERAEQELPHALLTADNAKLLAERLARLRGAAMKVGQMLSMEGDSMLPKEFAKALEVLRSSAHTMPEGQVRQVLTAAYGPDWQDLFAEFELTPMASASIGQVHRAVARDGREVAVKLQYPGVAESIDSDVDNLRSLLRLARLVPSELDLDALTDEVKAELRKEVDYERELQQLLAYRDALGERPGLRLPQPHADLSRPRVLALELVPGVPLLTWGEHAPQEQRDAVATRLLELLATELFDIGLMQTDPNPANYLYDADREDLVLLDFGATREVPPDVADLYRQAFSGIAARDEHRLRDVLLRLGIGGTAEDREASDILIRVALEASEVLDEGGYDFAASDLPERLQALGKELRRYRTQLRPPPPAYLFFQRKLGGTFLLCRQLRARTNGRAALRAAGAL